MGAGSHRVWPQWAISAPSGPHLSMCSALFVSVTHIKVSKVETIAKERVADREKTCLVALGTVEKEACWCVCMCVCVCVCMPNLPACVRAFVPRPLHIVQSVAELAWPLPGEEGPLKLIEACGQRGVGGMGEWTERERERDGQRGRKTERQHNVAHTHTHASVWKHFWLLKQKLLATGDTTCISSPPQLRVYLFFIPLPTWAWDKNAARHQVLLWQQRTAQVRIIWTDAVVNENNNTFDYKH